MTTTNGLTFTADVSVDSEELLDLDELEYDFTRIEASNFGFTATAVMKIPHQKVMQYVDVEISPGGVND